MLRGAPWLLYALVVVVFACLSPKFLAAGNFVNILVQSAPIAIVAVGMTFVLLTAGIDLSVGSVIFLAGAVGGSLVVRAGWPVGAVLPVMALVGLACGVLNGLLVTRLRLSPFIVTLAMLFIARGLGLWITETRDQSAGSVPAARGSAVAVDPVARLDPGRHRSSGAVHVEPHAVRPPVIRCGTRRGGRSEGGHRGGPDPVAGVHHLRHRCGCGRHDHARTTGRCVAQHGAGARAGRDCRSCAGGRSLFGGRGTALAQCWAHC